MEIFKEFKFEAAHFLPHVPPGHKCRAVHGHSYFVRVTLRGEVDPVLGWVVDFSELSEAWQPLHRQLDHTLLNDVPGLDNPTSEHLARFVWEGLSRKFPTLLARVEVRETCTSGCLFDGPSP